MQNVIPWSPLRVFKLQEKPPASQRSDPALHLFLFLWVIFSESGSTNQIESGSETD
jgi:hypothetical protein